MASSDPGPLIQVLERVSTLLGQPGNDFTWSSWGDADAALAEVDRHLDALREGRPINRLELTVLFAPTGPMQEVSLSSGWGKTFGELASTFDRALENYEDPPAG